MAKKQPYDPRIDPDDTKRAEALFTHVIIPTLEHPRYIVSTGTCPRCRDSMKHEHPLTIVVPKNIDVATRDRALEAVEEAIDLSRGEAEFDVECSCGQDHPGHPEGKLSCGSKFRLAVSWP
jgi:hypothetical protein